MSEQKEFQQRLQKIEELVRDIESAADPHLRASAIELMQTLMELHGAGLGRMMEIIFDSGDQGVEIIDALGRDELAKSLLLLYDLHPLNMETRVMQALDKVRPYLQSHGGNVELLGMQDGIVCLRLTGSCYGCGSSQMTLKLAIEEAIFESAPDVAALEVEGVVEQMPKPSGLVQLESRSNGNGKAVAANGWKDVSGLLALANGAAQIIEVSERPVIFCRLDETYYAYSDICPDCGTTMLSTYLESTTLVCPSCHGRFDVTRAGRSLPKPDLHLEPFPLLVEQSRAKIALPH
jgi:Fe-S cluster biogenesis protein NfuA/nitrite reductase/ring-hydroxylating ferredoxin subunit